MSYADERSSGFSPLEFGVRRSELGKTSDCFGRSRKVRVLKKTQVWADIAEPRYLFGYRADFTHYVEGHISKVQKI